MHSISFEVISLNPHAFDVLNNMGVISRALKKNLIKVNLYDLREYGEGAYKQVDDEPYGGGSGMLLKPEPIYKAYESINKDLNSLTLLMTPQGKSLKQSDFIRWTEFKQIIIICGQYEGFDERVRPLANEEISLGEFVLTGGELPAISIINGLSRLIPGTLGDFKSLQDESHNEGLLEYPQYTRPKIYRGMQVPSILLSGNHKEINIWRRNQMFNRTFKRRNDLISPKNFNKLSLKKKFNNAIDTLDNYFYPDW